MLRRLVWNVYVCGGEEMSGGRAVVTVMEEGGEEEGEAGGADIVVAVGRRSAGSVGRGGSMGGREGGNLIYFS